jgi:hypothetical protein
MTTAYLGGQQLDHAQAVLDRHPVSSASGLCVTCSVPGPCAEYEAAADVFTRSARLPRRRPGASRPQLLGAKRMDFRRQSQAG